MFTSYAQNFEDLMLWKALRLVSKGFYIDIGAQHPLTDSVSHAFYLKGWRGVHVEPVPTYAEALRSERPDETVIQAAVGVEHGVMDFFEVVGTGWSTGKSSVAGGFAAKGVASRRITVVSVTLESLLDNYRDRTIHWLKIDVEGMEGDVIKSWGASLVRPWIVVVEATVPTTQFPSYADWEPQLTQLDYIFAYTDGLNRFYVSEEHPELIEAFRYPPNVFDDYALSGTAQNSVCSLLNSKIAEKEEYASKEHQGYREAQATLESTRKQLMLETDRNAANAQRADETAAALVSVNLQNEQLLKEFASKDMLLAEARNEARAIQLEADANLSRFMEASERQQRRIAEIQGSLLNYVREFTRSEFVIKEKDQRQEALQSDLHKHKERLEALQSKLNTIRTSISWKSTSALRILGFDRAIARAMALRDAGEVIDLNEILAKEGDDFVRQAYRSILMRDPDTEGGAHYRQQLARGFGKTEILGILRYSAEGRFKNATVPGLAFRYRILRFKRSIGLRTNTTHKTRQPLLLESLLAFNGKDFVNHAYKMILQRPPDTDGFQFYANRLKSGTSKVQIIGELRYSSEGRKNPVRVEHLRGRLNLEKLSRVPFIGRIFWAWVHSAADSVWCEEHQRWCLRHDSR